MFNSQETSSPDVLRELQGTQQSHCDQNNKVKRDNPSVKGKKVMENSGMRHLTGGKMPFSAHKRDYIQVQLNNDARDEIMEVDAGTSVEKHSHINVQVNTEVLDQIQIGLDKTDSEEVMCVDKDERVIRIRIRKDDQIETQMKTNPVFEDTLVKNDDIVPEKTTFERHANIKVEMDTSVDEDNFICDHCHVMYKSHRCFLIHEKICGELQEKIKLQKQAEPSTGIKRREKILCENCPNFFNSLDSYSAHKERHNKDNQSNQFLCDQCPTLCSSEDSLKSHYACMHKASCNIEVISWESGPFENDEPDETRRKESCKQCGYDTNDKEDLNRHIKTIHDGDKYYCNQCEYIASSKYRLAKHIQAAHEGTNERSFECKLCEYKTKRKSHLSKHARLVHEGERRFECSLCEFKAKRKSHVSEHTRVVHEGVTYKCDKCDFQTQWKNNLNTHVASVHEGITHDCHLCHYKAAKRAHLIYHVSFVHEKITNHCEECTFKTKCSQYLADHTASVHKGVIYSSKPERCPECGKRHFKGIEEKFICTECSKPFLSNGDLQVHMRVHTGEKPYICTVCQKAFSKSSNLQVHTRIHTGEMPFQCPECVKRFRELGQLKKHMLKIHGIDYKSLTPNKRNMNKE